MVLPEIRGLVQTCFAGRGQIRSMDRSNSVNGSLYTETTTEITPPPPPPSTVESISISKNEEEEVFFQNSVPPVLVIKWEYIVYKIPAVETPSSFSFDLKDLASLLEAVPEERQSKPASAKL